MSNVQDAVSSTTTELSSVMENVTDPALLSDLQDLQNSVNDLGDSLLASGGLLEAAGRLKRGTGFYSFNSYFAAPNCFINAHICAALMIADDSCD